MKNWIVIFLFLSLTAFPAKVYVSSERNGAKKVFITTNKTEAQMIVFFVSDANQANKKWFWFKVSDRNSCDMAIHYVTDKQQAELIIYITNDKNCAGYVRK